jgi:hypothetical protein
MYEVLSDINVLEKVTDEDIEKSILEGHPLKSEIIMAMGCSHKIKYLPYIYPYLNDERLHIRLRAADSIMWIDGRKGLEKLKEKEQQFDETDYEYELSEKALLNARILRVEKGVEGVREYFFSEDANEVIQYDLLTYYGKGYPYQAEDIKLILELLDGYIEKEMSWIRRLSRGDYSDAVLFTLDSISYASENTDLFANMDDSLYEQMYHVFKKITEMRITMDTKEEMANMTMYMRKEYAIKVLQLLKGKTRGTAQTAYKRALKFWRLDESSL